MPSITSLTDEIKNLNIRSEYEYQPLDLSTDNIRLLTLHPGNEDDPICCSLSHVSLRSEVAYEALSYTWGDYQDARTIILDSHPVSVTANLETALRRLRYPALPKDGLAREAQPQEGNAGKERIVWVDALCINQNDVKERGHQVRRMDKIFSSGRKVLVWLGDEADESDVAMDFLKCIDRGEGLFDTNGAALTSETVWKALHKLWARPYWGRVWIIQELASAIVKEETMFVPQYHAEVGCGNKWLRFDIIQNAWHYLDKYRSHPYVHGNGEYVTVRNLFTILFEYAHKRLTLGALISLTYTAHATDPRDHFYAILGLAPEADRAVLIPDYSKSLTEVCGIFIKHVIERERSLDILAFDHSDCEAPSWAPNFSLQSRSASIGWRPYWQNFRASGDVGTNPPNARFSDTLGRLSLTGFIVDYIETIDGPFIDVDAFLRDSNNLLKSSLISRTLQAYHDRKWWDSRDSLVSCISESLETRSDPELSLEDFRTIGRGTSQELAQDLKQYLISELYLAHEQDLEEEAEEHFDQTRRRTLFKDLLQIFGRRLSGFVERLYKVLTISLELELVENGWQWFAAKITQLYGVEPQPEVLETVKQRLRDYSKVWTMWGWYVVELKEELYVVFRESLKTAFSDRFRMGIGLRFEGKLKHGLQRWLEHWMGSVSHRVNRDIQRLAPAMERIFWREAKYSLFKVPRYKDYLTVVGKLLALDHHFEANRSIAKRGTPGSFCLFYEALLDPTYKARMYRREGNESAAESSTMTAREEDQRDLFNQSAQQALDNRCFFTTKKGYFGVGPRDTRRGQVVVIFLGGNMPFIVEKQEKHHCLIGEAYVHGIMDGELMKKPQLEEFHLE